MYRELRGLYVGAALLGGLAVLITLGAPGCILGPLPTVLLAKDFRLDVAWTHPDPPPEGSDPNLGMDRFDASFKPTAVGKVIRVTASSTKLDTRVGMKVTDGDDNTVIYVLNMDSSTTAEAFTSTSTNEHNVVVWELVNPGGKSYGILVTEDP
ncbi:MAG: hypothetical protein JXQ73_22285 [Phycisphaerae bacterium]|nr:hypothetical protein [Phycisphaerae bacterium]